MQVVFSYDHVGSTLMPWTDTLMLLMLSVAGNSGNFVVPFKLCVGESSVLIKSVNVDTVDTTEKLVPSNHNSTYLFASDKAQCSYKKQ